MEITGEIKQRPQGRPDEAAAGRVRENANTHDLPTKPTDATTAAANAEAAAVSQRERLSDILQAYGYKVTDKNLAMLTLMLDNALSLTPENVAKMNQALRLTDAPEKALFLLLNGLRLNQANAAQLDGLTDGRVRIAEQISNLLTAISELPDTALRGTLLRLFAGVENADTTLEAGAAGTGATADAEAKALNTQTAPTAPLSNAPQATTTTTTATAQTAATMTAPAQTTPAQTPSQGQQPPAESPVSTTQTGPQGQAQGQTQAAAAPTVPQGQAQTTQPQTAAPLPAASPPENAASTAATDESGQPGSTARIEARTSEAHVTRGGTTTEAAVNRLDYGDAVPARTVHESAPQPVEHTPPRLSFKLQDSMPEDIDRFFNTLRDALGEARRTLADTRAPSPEMEQVARQVQSLSEHIDFVAQIKNQLFVQLPVFHNGQETNTSLHVYKDAKQDKQSGGHSHSALIALETASMGHFETYVQKRTQSVSCQFRLRDKAVEQLVRANIHKLDALLREYHYSLDAFSFLPSGEPYTLLDNPAQFDGEAAATGSETAFVFDKKI